MPSQQLPKSSKFESLPPDLKGIAEKLIRKKFGIKPEPEVIEKGWGNATWSSTPEPWTHQPNVRLVSFSVPRHTSPDRDYMVRSDPRYTSHMWVDLDGENMHAKEFQRYFMERYGVRLDIKVVK